MKNLRKNIFYLLFFLLLSVCFLFHAKKTAQFAYIGLKTWFDRMIISLFPFLVLMNVLLKTGLSDLFIRPFYYALRPLLRNSSDAVFVIFFGFLCGFPLGGKSTVDLYKKGRLSKENAEYLLCFANNIGPAYMLGFFLELLSPSSTTIFSIFCLYGIPLLYGIFLRYTVYKKQLDKEYAQRKNQSQMYPYQNPISVLPEAVSDSLMQLTMLGGYMIIFNALRIVPHLLFVNHPNLYIVAQSLLEISGGLLCVSSSIADGILKNICLYAVFSFNGLCCHFQTLSLLQGTSLSGQKYMLHKIILCSITVLFVWLFG